MLRDGSFIATKDQVTAELQDEAVVLHLISGIYYGLDPVGVRIWELLQNAMSFDDLLTTLLDEFDVEPDTCERDILALLERLVDARLIDVVYA